MTHINRERQTDTHRYKERHTDTDIATDRDTNMQRERPLYR